MIELYLHEHALKVERELLDRQSAHRAFSLERLSHATPRKAAGLRRQLALALLALADRLDPRPVLRTTHAAGRPALNGKLHHA